MHELSIAVSLVEVSCEELARQAGAHVEALHVRIGPLSGVVPRSLASAFELASEGTPLQGARLAIEETRIRVLCRSCSSERPIDGILSFRCADCGMPTPEIIGGRELELVCLEISGEPVEC